MANRRSLSQRIKHKESELETLRQKNKELTEGAWIKCLHKLEGKFNCELEPHDIKKIYGLIESNLKVFAKELGLISDEPSSPSTEK